VSVSLQQFGLTRSKPRGPAWRFRRLHLCEWPETAEDRARHARVGRSPAEGFEERPCWAGLDLGNSRDFSALALAWKPDESGVVPCRVWLWLLADRLTE
jgi:hypothetical protein